jgi:intracellular sulfur oxidation DsrE/DsrF family protein
MVGTVLATSPGLLAQNTVAVTWRPARHKQDDWLDKLPGQHRVVFDTNTADGMGLALLFARNYYFASQQGYQLQNRDLAVVIVARHRSTAFAFNSAMWAKYGKQLSEHSMFVEPNTKEPPKVNFYNTETEQTPAFIDWLVQRGAHFAVCQMSTQTIAYNIATATNSDQAKIVEELSANLVGNSHPVTAGIVTVTRAQERGYAFVHGS